MSTSANTLSFTAYPPGIIDGIRTKFGPLVAVLFAQIADENPCLDEARKDLGHWLGEEGAGDDCSVSDYEHRASEGSSTPRWLPLSTLEISFFSGEEKCTATDTVCKMLVQSMSLRGGVDEVDEGREQPTFSLHDLRFLPQLLSL
ncbi:hypothetical protein PG997_010730 [Apiospora hydei]|uniref:Uncharacterized protein n=1 Tax=Apiospora hydei TaxID=1337664 RepID=A0ABR1VHA6_9PEZI